MTLDDWLDAHHDAGWKPKKPSLVKPVKFRGGKSNGFNDLVNKYKYAVTVTLDYRTIKEPVSLDEFISRKTSVKYKPWSLPKPRVLLTKLSAKQRAIEMWDVQKVVAQYGKAV